LKEQEMERHTLHDAATNAAGQGQGSHSYSAWRTAQQTQPRIFQYNPPNIQQTAHQQQQQQQQQTQQQSQMSANPTASGAANVNIAANLDKNIIFANSERLAQQYNLQNPGTQQPPFTALHDDPSSSQDSADGVLGQDGNANNPGDKDAPGTAPGGRVLAQSKRAAQNRAAQRAFRQRKDRYIKSLEQKANEYDLSHSIITDLRKENIYLRDYVVRLQNEVDSLNTELGRAPMFATPTTQQRNTQQGQNQATTMPVSLGQNYPIQIDPQTTAVAAAGNVHAQDNQLVRLAPTDGSHNAIGMPVGNEQQLVGEGQKPEETVAQPKKGNRGRKRKNETQVEGQ
jgi:hypothetical protein